VTLVVVAALGAALGTAGRWLLRDLLAQSTFERTNYRGVVLPTAGGLVLVAVALGGEVMLTAAADRTDLALENREARRAVVVAVVGFGLLGLLDDLTGDRGPTGYRGHLRALVGGRVTTGALKVLGGGVVALVCTVMAVDGRSVGWVLADGALVALAANLGNLLDRRPGRVEKVAVLTGVVSAVAAWGDPGLVGTMLIVGGAGALLVPDLRERLMLGDTGANPLGAALGLGVVVVAPPEGRLAVLALVLALNVISERVSFTGVIESRPALRWFDQLGRLR
jgi:UDP-GlcNAc:undecaprenyl-phosphate/decaprenyl-phosphate GlcNAc-1-phosphate transferase